MIEIIFALLAFRFANALPSGSKSIGNSFNHGEIFNDNAGTDIEIDHALAFSDMMKDYDDVKEPLLTAEIRKGEAYSVTKEATDQNQSQSYEYIQFENGAKIPLVSDIALAKQELVEFDDIPMDFVDQCIIDGYHSSISKDVKKI